MRRLVPFVVLFATACKGKGDREPPAKAAEGPAPTPPEALAGTRPAPLGAVASLPRADWPCKAKAKILDDVDAELRFVYDGPAACRVPVELQADGVVGCPTVREQENLAMGLVTRTTYAYDDAGRLVGLEMGALVDATYVWDGDHLVETTSDGDASPYVQTPAGEVYRLTEQGTTHDLRLVLDGGRLARAEFVSFLGTAVQTLTWSGGRLARVDSVVDDTQEHFELVYDCGG